LAGLQAASTALLHPELIQVDLLADDSSALAPAHQDVTQPQDNPPALLDSSQFGKTQILQIREGDFVVAVSAHQGVTKPQGIFPSLLDSSAQSLLVNLLSGVPAALSG